MSSFCLELPNRRGQNYYSIIIYAQYSNDFYDQSASGGHGLRSERQVIVTGGLSFEFGGFVRSAHVGLPHFFRFMLCPQFLINRLVKNSLLDLLATGGLLGRVVSFLLFRNKFSIQFIIQSGHMKSRGEKSVGSVSGMRYKSYVTSGVARGSTPERAEEREMCWRQ